MVVADMILSTNLKNTRPFIEQPSQKDIVQTNFESSEFLSAAFAREENRKMKAKAAKSTYRSHTMNNSSEFKHQDSGLIARFDPKMVN
jgi:glutamine phosphoribosylpyrophosphate amidotransferase